MQALFWGKGKKFAGGQKRAVICSFFRRGIAPAAEIVYTGANL